MNQQTRFRGPSLTPTRSAAPAPKKQPASTTTPVTSLDNDELRMRIFANAAVLYPSSSTQHNAYEIVYGMQASRHSTAEAGGGESSFSRYAMLVRRSPSGEFAPLLRGLASSTTLPWSMVLQSLLDVTAVAVHKKLGMRQLPAWGANEELPRYSPSVAS